MKLYRGISYNRANDIINGREEIGATSNGEFGNGSYYWKDDIAAGVMSALQYYGQQEGGWAVLCLKLRRRDLTFHNTTILDFRDTTGMGKNFDPSTLTASRDVQISQFDNAIVRMNFSEFREINADPEGHYMTGTKNTLTWPNYNIIAGPTVAAPKDVNLTQLKFAHDGIDLLNTLDKVIVIRGSVLNDSTFSKVRSWKLENRKRIYDNYFTGRTNVSLSL